VTAPTTLGGFHRACRPDAPADELARAAAGLESLARTALAAGEGEAYEAYQGVLFALYEDDDPSTDAARRWLVSRVTPIEDAHVPLPAEKPALAPRAFLATIESGLSMRARLGSEMARHLFDGAPPIEDVALYILHHWYRSRGFYRLLADFALHAPLAHAAALYDNLGDEAGAGGTLPHPVLLQRLVRHLDQPSGFADRPRELEALVYLNNRWRCARHPDPQWGLAVLYALEYTTTETHRNILGMLERAGLPADACEFHRLHASCDEQHAALMVEHIYEVTQTAEQQRRFRASLARHQALSRAYFQRIWRTMRPPGAP
jgi:pyrroloquinoline quinone (PQQ) biosynthesis protein C